MLRNYLKIIWRNMMKDRQFTLLNLLGLSFPLVWWAMNNWLNDFAYRVSIRADVFLITAVCAMVITVITIGFQALKAAMANPVKSLRAE